VTSIDAVHKHISQAVLLVVQSPQAAAQRQEEAKDALRSAVGTLREKLDEAVQQAAQRTTQASTQPQPQKDAAAEQQTAVVTVQTAAAALEVAHTLAQFEMADAERQKPRPSRDVINNYNFACAVLRARAPAAFAEVEKLQAQSKFFRSLATGILLVGDAFLLALAVRPGSVGQTPQPPMWNGIVLPTGVPWWVACIGWAVSLITSLVLYNNMRQKAVDEAYQSAVVAFALGAKPEVPGAGVAKSAAQA
jgi:hypothetical protein